LIEIGRAAYYNIFAAAQLSRTAVVALTLLVTLCYKNDSRTPAKHSAFGVPQ
jgi:hypothetical protein